MSAGNDGLKGPPPGVAGGAWPSFPPTHAQPAVVPPPAAPQKMTRAGGPFRAPDAPGASESAFEVDMPLQYRIPMRCACCAGPHQTNVVTRGVATRYRTHERRSLQVPYCLRCAAHLRAGRRRAWCISLFALAAGSVAPLLVYAAWTYVPAAIFFGSAAIVALAASFVMARVWKAPPIDRAQGCSSAGTPAMWIRGFKFHAPTTQVQFTHRAFADDVASAHGVIPRTVGPPSVGNAGWIVALVLATLASVPVFFATHGHVYLDNPSTLPLQFDIDDGSAVIDVPAGQHEAAYLPTGDVEIVVTSGGPPIDRFNGEVDGFTTHVASPFGSACYGSYDIAYGTASANGHGIALESMGVRWHTLHGVDFVLETPPSSVDVGRGQTGAVKTRFVRLDCETHRVIE